MPTTESDGDVSASDLQKLVSPNGFDGRGPVPERVKLAAKTIAELRRKFASDWTTETGNPLTWREMEYLFDAAAIQAEWMRELYEARHGEESS